MNMGHRFRLIAVPLAILIPCGIAYPVFRQKAHGFNRGMNATCM